MKPFLIDTSGWCAIYNETDSNHPKALSFWSKAATQIGTLYTSDYILDETLTLLNVGISHEAAVKFGRAILASKVIQIVPITAPRWETAWVRTFAAASLPRYLLYTVLTVGK